MNSIHRAEFPIEWNVVYREEGAYRYAGDYDPVGKEPIRSVSARLEAHTDTKFRDRDLVHGGARGERKGSTLVVRLEDHGTTTEADRSTGWLETGNDLVGC